MVLEYVLEYQWYQMVPVDSPLARPNQFLSHSDLFEDKQLVCRVFNAFCVPCAELLTECVGDLLCVFATVPISEAKNVAS